MNAPAAPAPQPAGDARREQLLDVALTVFARHGYRKTSMDDIAQAAGVSRQGLYLHFEAKEDLFRAAVHHSIRKAHVAVAAALAAPGESIEQRLLSAFDEWVGRRYQAVGDDVDDLVGTCQRLLGPDLQTEKKAFARRIAAAIEAEGLAAVHERNHISSKDLALTLCATAYGLKQIQPTRAAFVAAMRTAIRAFCLPFKPNR